MAQNKYNPLKLYAMVTQYLIMIAVLTIGGYLVGRFLIFKTSLAGGVIATVGALFGIIFFIIELLRIGKVNHE